MIRTILILTDMAVSLIQTPDALAWPALVMINGDENMDT